MDSSTEAVKTSVAVSQFPAILFVGVWRSFDTAFNGYGVTRIVYF